MPDETLQLPDVNVTAPEPALIVAPEARKQPSPTIVVVIECYLGGTLMRIFNFSVTGSSQGNGGSSDVSTTLEALAQDRVDYDGLISASPPSEADIYVTLAGVRSHLFGGEAIKYTVDYDTGEVHFHFRDHTSRLQDKKRVFNSQNKKLKQVVPEIGDPYGLSPKVDPPPDETDLPIGSDYGSNDQVFAPVPQTPWSALTKLSKSNGKEVYVDPDKNLIVAEPGSGELLNLAYGMNPVPDGYVPCLNLKIERSPVRHGKFKTKVLSYHPATATTTKGTSSYSSDPHSLMPSDPDESEEPYAHRQDGLSDAQAQDVADSATTDIAKREFMLEAEMDLLPGLRPLQLVRVSGPTLNPLHASTEFHVASFTHTFSMPSHHGHGGFGGHHGGSGNVGDAELKTVIKCLRPTKKRRGGKETDVKGAGELQ